MSKGNREWNGKPARVIRKGLTEFKLQFVSHEDPGQNQNKEEKEPV